jgi:hypothetical protein
MAPDQIALVVALHARRILQARSFEASSDRRLDNDPDRAQQAGDDAAMCRAEAAALAALLQAAGADVLIPDAGQLSLLGDGQ